MRKQIGVTAAVAWGGLALVSLGHASVDFYVGLLSPLMPTIVKQLGLSMTLAASIMSIASALSSLSQPFFGYMIDRGGRNTLIAASVLWTGLFVSALGLAHSYWPMVIIALLGSLGSAFFHPLGSANASGLAGGSGNQGLAMAIYSTGGSFGYSLAPLVIGPLLAAGGLSRLPWLSGVAIACSLTMLAAGIHRVPAPSSRRVASRGLLDGLAGKWRPLLAVFTVVSLRAWAQTAIIYLIPFAHAGRGANQLLTLYMLAGTAGGLIGGFISDRIGRKPMLIASSALAIPCLYLGAVLTGSWSWATMAIGGAILNAAFPPTVVYAQELVPGNAAFASGLTMGMAWGVGALGLTLTGFVADHLGIQAAMLSNLLLLVIAVLFTAPLKMRTADRAGAA